jgi:hypothetical protein
MEKPLQEASCRQSSMITVDDDLQGQYYGGLTHRIALENVAGYNYTDYSSIFLPLRGTSSNLNQSQSPS